MVEITSTTDDAIHTIFINGEVDASSSIELDDAINNAINEGQKKIIIDCNQLEYISSAGLGVFMSNIQEFEDKEIKMILCELNEKVSHVFNILGLDQLLKIVETKKDAKQLL